MSDTAVALISAGSALAASLITGCITLLTGRSHLALQLQDQKQARHEQQRRDIYAADSALLTEALGLMAALSWHRAEGETTQMASVGARLADVQQSLVMRAVATDLVGPASVVRAFDAARSALDDAAKALDRLPSDAVPSPYLVAAELSTFTQCLNAFTHAGRAALGMD